MVSHDLYEIQKLSVDEAKPILESRLNISLIERESSYIGDYLQGSGIASEVFIVRNNEDPIDHEPAERNFPESVVLLYVDATVRSRELKKLLDADGDIFRLLRHEEKN